MIFGFFVSKSVFRMPAFRKWFASSSSSTSSGSPVMYIQGFSFGAVQPGLRFLDAFFFFFLSAAAAAAAGAGAETARNNNRYCNIPSIVYGQSDSHRHAVQTRTHRIYYWREHTQANIQHYYIMHYTTNILRARFHCRQAVLGQRADTVAAYASRADTQSIIAGQALRTRKQSMLDHIKISAQGMEAEPG